MLQVTFSKFVGYTMQSKILIIYFKLKKKSFDSRKVNNLLL